MPSFHGNERDGMLHVHACPVHPGGTDAGRNVYGERISDACLWAEHDAAYMSAWGPAARDGLDAQIASVDSRIAQFRQWRETLAVTRAGI